MRIPPYTVDDYPEVAERRAKPAVPPSTLTTVWEGMDSDAPLVALLTRLFCDGTPVALVSTHMILEGIAGTTHTPLGTITMLTNTQVWHTGLVGPTAIKHLIRVEVAAPTAEGATP